MALERKTATGSQRKRNAAETRNRLLQAARRLFAKANYGNVGIREIGAAAGVNPAFISRSFGSKRNLFLEVASILNSEGIEAPPDVPPKEKTSMPMGSISSGGI